MLWVHILYPTFKKRVWPHDRSCPEQKAERKEAGPGFLCMYFVHLSVSKFQKVFVFSKNEITRIAPFELICYEILCLKSIKQKNSSIDQLDLKQLFLPEKNGSIWILGWFARIGNGLVQAIITSRDF